MSRVVHAGRVSTEFRASAESAGPVRRMRKIGYVVLGLELTGFLLWSNVLYSHFALTSDFSVYHEAWFKIAHGNLDPYLTSVKFPYWRSHCEFVMWPIALLYWVWPHGVTLLWLQDICLIGAQAVAFTWICETAQRCRPGRDAAWLAGAGLVLLAADPWLWWTLSFDFHAEIIAILFAILLARDLSNGRRRAWVWVVPLLACGDVAGTYMAGVGLGEALAGRSSRLRGGIVMCLGLGLTLVISLAHANLGSQLDSYAYLAANGHTTSPPSVTALLAGIATHPLTVAQVLWSKRIDIWANLAPGGFLGIGELAILPAVVVVLLANDLHPGVIFAGPLFQSALIYILLPVGTATVLGWVARRHRRTALLLAGLIAAQTLGWAWVWGSRTVSQWLRVPTPAAATLAALEARIPHSARIVVSQGVAGRFSDRASVHVLAWTAPVPIHGETWFVIAPAAGIEIQNMESAEALIWELSERVHATLITHANNVWAFRWRPPAGVHELDPPQNSVILPAWASPATPGEAGRPVLDGPIRGWHMTSTGGRGYVADGISWWVPPGHYRAAVTMSATGPVNVEVWDDNRDHALIARRSIPATRGIQSISLPVYVVTAYIVKVYTGWGPFAADFTSPPPGQHLEVRVWSPGGARVNVYGAKLVGEGR